MQKKYEFVYDNGPYSKYYVIPKEIAVTKRTELETRLKRELQSLDEWYIDILPVEYLLLPKPVSNEYEIVHISHLCLDSEGRYCDTNKEGVYSVVKKEVSK